MEKHTWWKEAVVYQIYPRSFMDSNGDGIGDLNGITSRLDYLKELGISVIWLSPVYQSPNDDNGYDISDYRQIMKEFGTMDDFDRMLSEAHKRGIKIVMDLVVNHTSDEHKWFVESRKSKDNPYRDYYIWRAGKGQNQPPNNWGSCFSGSAWQYDEATDMYYLHLFSKKQADLNWDNEKVRDEVFSMMDWWCQKGIDGFRMDVICMISKTKDMPDGPAQPGSSYGDFSPYSIHGPNVHKYLKEMNEKVLSRYDLMTVGETPNVTVEDAKRYAGEDEHELNMVFQFEHVSIGNDTEGKWNTNKVPLPELKRIMSKWETGLEGSAWNSLYFGNHDQPRSVSRFGNDSAEYREISAKMLATCLHMMKGTPYVYQGEELGMTNFPFTDISQFRDIENLNAYHELVELEKSRDEKELIKCFQYKSRDNARTPMQWDDSTNAGFTTGEPWIAVNPNYKEINAKEEVPNPDSVFNYYKKLIALRKKYEIIVYGIYELLLPDDANLYVYTRTLDKEKLLVLCNFSDKEQQVSLPEEFAQKESEVLISNYDRKCGKVESLSPYEALVLHYNSF
jgi:oligo-1,6-glucosidase